MANNSLLARFNALNAFFVGPLPGPTMKCGCPVMPPTHPRHLAQRLKASLLTGTRPQTHTYMSRLGKEPDYLKIGPLNSLTFSFKHLLWPFIRDLSLKLA